MWVARRPATPLGGRAVKSDGKCSHSIHVSHPLQLSGLMDRSSWFYANLSRPVALHCVICTSIAATPACTLPSRLPHASATGENCVPPSTQKVNQTGNCNCKIFIFVENIFPASSQRCFEAKRHESERESWVHRWIVCWWKGLTDNSYTRAHQRWQELDLPAEERGRGERVLPALLCSVGDRKYNHAALNG